MALFKKTIRVWIEDSNNMIYSIISVNGTRLSRIQCVREADDVLLIGDIPPFDKKRDYCKGYGSKMMVELIKYSSQNGIRTIYGNLSLVDIKHKDRLHAFYKKHGFEIIEYDTPKSMYYGKVVKEI